MSKKEKSFTQTLELVRSELMFERPEAKPPDRFALSAYSCADAGWVGDGKMCEYHIDDLDGRFFGGSICVVAIITVSFFFVQNHPVFALLTILTTPLFLWLLRHHRQNLLWRAHRNERKLGGETQLADIIARTIFAEKTHHLNERQSEIGRTRTDLDHAYTGASSDIERIQENVARMPSELHTSMKEQIKNTTQRKEQLERVRKSLGELIEKSLAVYVECESRTGVLQQTLVDVKETSTAKNRQAAVKSVLDDVEARLVRLDLSLAPLSAYIKEHPVALMAYNDLELFYGRVYSAMSIIKNFN